MAVVASSYENNITNDAETKTSAPIQSNPIHGWIPIHDQLWRYTDTVTKTAALYSARRRSVAGSDAVEDGQSSSNTFAAATSIVCVQLISNNTASCIKDYQCPPSTHDSCQHTKTL